MSTAFDMSRPRTFNLPPMDIPDPAFGNVVDLQPPANAINPKATRWLYYPGDTVAPERKNEMEYTAEGGHDINSVCLVRTRGFLPKGKMCPLETGYRWAPADVLVNPDKVEVFAAPLPGAQYAPPGLALGGLAILPGHEMTNIMGRMTNDQGLPTGHVDITPLIGVTWESGEVQKLNRLFVPKGKAAKTLRELKQDIENGSKLSGDNAIKEIADLMLKGCGKFAHWANRHIARANALLGDHSKEWVYNYTSIDELLLEQLEIPRQDRVLQNSEATQRTLMEAVTKMAEQAAARDSRPAPTMEEIAQMMTTMFAKAMQAERPQPEKPQGNQGNQNRK